MAQVGSLVIDLIAQTASFNANIKRASANLNGEAARMNRSLASIERNIQTVVSAGKALVGAQIVGELARVAKAGLEYASSLGEVSQQIGVTTQDLQVYRYAATQVGLSQEEMDKGLQKLTRTLGDAQNGSKSASAVFAALGVELRTANGHFRTTSEVLPDLADAISKIPDPARRASVEVQLFGKSGQKLDTLLAGGSEAVDQLRNAAQRLGIVLSDEQIQKADETADKLAEIKMVLEARIAGVVAENAGAIYDLANALATAASATLNFLGSWAKTGPAFEKRDRMAAFAKAEIDRNKSLSDAEKARAKVAIDKEVDRKFGVKRSSSFGGLIESRSIDLSTVDPKGASPISAPRVLAGGGELGQFLAPGSGKKGKAAKPKVEKTWLDDFREMQAEMSRNLGNEMAMMDPFDNSTSKMVDNFLSETGKIQQRSEELAVQMQRDTKVMKTSFADASNGILYSLRDMSDGLRSGDFLSALQGVVNLFLQLGSIGVFGKGLATNINAGGKKGFASGGYTGSMGTSDVAGVVHGQEYVFDAKAVRRIGVGNLERLRAGSGFKNGGFTGGAVSRAMAGLVPTTRVEIVPNAMFEAVVDGRAQAVAGPIGVRAAQSGAGLAQENLTRRGRNRIPGR